MGETIVGIPLSDLVEGNIFDKDELIIEKSEDGMSTIRRDASDSDEIRYFQYDFQLINDGFCDVHNNGYGEISPGNPSYVEYKEKLEMKEIW